MVRLPLTLKAALLVAVASCLGNLFRVAAGTAAASAATATTTIAARPTAVAAATPEVSPASLTAPIAIPTAAASVSAPPAGPRVAQTLTVRNAWSRATAPGAPVGVVYFDIVNTGAADELFGIESPAAQRVEMHATTMVGGMMEMRPAETVAVPAKGRVTFGPGGLHAMLMDMKQPLVEGAKIPLTLVFRHAGRVAAQAVVLGSGATTGPTDVPTPESRHPVAYPPATVSASVAATYAAAHPLATGHPPAAAGEPAATAVPAASTESAPRLSAGPPGPVAPGPAGAGYRLAIWPPHAVSPDFALVDAAGRARTLADYRGRVVVLFFGFVHCPDVCPAELFKLALVMKQLGSTAAHVQVLFVTLDPARDTRKVLKSYVTTFDPRFVGLTGSPSQIDRAAANFYVEYARVPRGTDYTIDHSTSTFVLDAGGRLRLIGTTRAGVADYAHDLQLLVVE